MSAKSSPVPDTAAKPPAFPVPEERPEEEHDLGSIHIHNSVIAAIARMAASKVPGVVDLVGSLVDDIAGLVGRKQIDRGVHVEIAENSLVIEITLTVEYGVNIPKVAWQVQSEVRQDVERMSGKPVRSVNVIVQGLRTPAPADSGARSPEAPA